MSNINILLFEKNAMLSHRISNILKNSCDAFLVATSETQLFSYLNETIKNQLIIYDCDGETDRNLAIIKKLKQSLHNVPLVILSSNNHKNFFLEVLMEGASDFILKPFQDNLFLDRITPLLVNQIKAVPVAQVTFNFSQYLMGEIEKAQKGKFSLSIMFLTYVNKDGTKTSDSSDDIDELLFNEFKSVFWQTDVFFQFGTKSYLGVFPFCNYKNSQLIHEKLQKRFDELSEVSPFLARYKVYSIFSTYPDDASDCHTLGDNLINKAKIMVDDTIDFPI